MMALASCYNYFMCGNQQPLTNINVVIDIQEDLACWTAYHTTDKGVRANTEFSFQLNAWSSPNGNACWQQYVFVLSNIGGQQARLTTRIEYWSSSSFAGSTPAIPAKGEFINTSESTFNSDQMPSGTLPQQKLLAGSKLIILLGNDDATGQVNSVVFEAFGPGNTPLFASFAAIDILSLQTNGPNLPVPPDALSPIYAFQVNLVGASGGKALLSSGAGTITYNAAQPLTAVTQLPTWTGAQTIPSTGETANSVYGDLVAGPDNSFAQPFATCGYTPGGRLAASQQFGDPNRTNLYAIGSSGQLTMFNVEGGGQWYWHNPIGPTTFPPFDPPFAPPGAALAASQGFGIADQTDVFVIDNTGQLNWFWCDNGTTGWTGPQQISMPPFAAPPGASLAASRFGAADVTGVFVVDHAGTLTVFSVQATGAWRGPTPISDVGFAAPGASVAAFSGLGRPDQIDVFVTDTAGALHVFSQAGTGAWVPSKVSGRGFVADGSAPIAVSPRFGVAQQINVFVVDQNGQLYAFSVEHRAGLHAGLVWRATPIGPGLDPDSGAPFALPASPVAVSQQFGAADQTDVFVVDITGGLNVFWANGDGGWSGPQQLASAAGGGLNVPSGSCVVASQQFGATNQTDVFLINTAPSSGLPVEPAPGWPVVFWVNGSGPWNGPEVLTLQV
jgi:hypothetical protein